MRAGGSAVLTAGGVATQVGLGEVEDQPAVADVGEREAELVAEEGAQGLGRRGVEQGMDAANHESLLDAAGGKPELRLGCRPPADSEAEQGAEPPGPVSALRGRPLGRATGTRGYSRAHCSSVRSLGYFVVFMPPL